MSSNFLQGLSAMLGVLLQLGVALLLASLFLGRGRRGRRGGEGQEEGAGLWGLVWLMQAVAVGTLVMRFVLLPNLDLTHLQEGSALVRALYTVYALAKVAFFAFIAAAAVRLRRPAREADLLRGLWMLAAVQACVAVAAAGDLTRTVQWNAPFGATCQLVAAAMVWRTRGTQARFGRGLATAALVLMATVSISQVEVFREAPRSELDRMTGLRYWLHQGYTVHYNSEIDMVLQLLLGGGILRLLGTPASRPSASRPVPSES